MQVASTVMCDMCDAYHLSECSTPTEPGDLTEGGLAELIVTVTVRFASAERSTPASQ